MRAQQLLVGVGPIFSISFDLSRRLRARRQGWVPIVAAAAAAEQNHYVVLGLNLSASSADVKSAYRLLARKYHPDVCKDSKASEVFKTIRLAYEVLSNEATRTRYDRALKFREETGISSKSKSNSSRQQQQHKRPRKEKYYDESKRRTQRNRYWDDNDERIGRGNSAIHERGSFGEVLRSALVCLFLLRTFGSRFSIAFSGVMALADWKLDNGYKMGYVIAWIWGGRGGVALTLCLSFASWVCGKTSSGAVALAVVATWVAAGLARLVPMPRGALLTLFYMSIKLQADLV